MNYNVFKDFQINLKKKSTTKTINNYQKKDVMQALFDSINTGLIVHSNYWGAELFASGFYLSLWDCFFKFYFKYIHCLNPLLIDYINQKYLLLNQIKKMYSGNLKNLCNNQELRNHIAEIMTIFCLSQKKEIKLPLSVNDLEITDRMIQKTDLIIQIVVPYLSTQSFVYAQYRSFIISYYLGDLDNCLYYIDWFVKENEHTINPFVEFKIPSAISRKSMWLIWKFLFLQYQKSSKTEKNCQQILQLLEMLISIYIIVYKRKDFETCSYILFFVTNLFKQPHNMNWDQSIDITSPELIKQCAEINNIYKNLQFSYEKIQTQNETLNKNKKGRKNKKEKDKQRFYQNPKNLEYLKVLYDDQALRPTIPK